MARDLGVPVGYSDHSLGIEASLAAVALGAVVIEKHLTLDRSPARPGPRASLEPAAFAAMVRGIRRIERCGRRREGAAARGAGCRPRRPPQHRRPAVDIPAGTRLRPAMLACRRPATGIAPASRTAWSDARARVAIAAGTVLQWDQLRWP
jgi:N,N'-diacetyllegionaminate synthase